MLWFTCMRDLSSSNPPLSYSREPAAAISRKLFSDLAQVDWLRTSPSTGCVPNKAEYALSQDGWISFLQRRIMNSEFHGSNLRRVESDRTKNIVLASCTLARMKICNTSRFIHKINGWLSMPGFGEELIPFRFIHNQTWAWHKVWGCKYFARWDRHGNFREFTPNGAYPLSESFPIANRWWISSSTWMDVKVGAFC